MAVKRIGFLDNFTTTPDRGGRRRSYGPNTYVRSGPPASSPYYRHIAATYRAPEKTKVNTDFQTPMPQQPPVTSLAEPSAPPGPAEDPAITSDPILLKAKKLAETQRADARTTAAARRKELAVQTGDAGLAREFGLDEAVQKAASENPLSTLALLRDEARREEKRFNEQAAAENLFFGGYRGEQLGELSRALLAREASTQARARESFTAIERALLDALGAADQLELDAEANAYASAVERGEGTAPVQAPPADAGTFGLPLTALEAALAEPVLAARDSRGAYDPLAAFLRRRRGSGGAGGADLNFVL